MNIRQIILMVLGFAWYSFCFSQEVQIDLELNTALKKNSLFEFNKGKTTFQTSSDTLNLPFIDDFSNNKIYPDTSMWADSFAFINNAYPFEPPTIGVATLDGVDKYGIPYDFSNPNSYGDADVLTSLPINLQYPASDSVYLSFYYQPEGLGNDPETDDSLVLEFTADTTWKTMWSDTGSAMKSFSLVMISITDSLYLKKGFRFRFRNKATLSGNLDHWHIDYVYLDRLRTIVNTELSDVAFIYNSTSLLKNYTEMPYSHFLVNPSAALVSRPKIWIKNHFSINQNTTYRYNIYYDDSVKYKYISPNYDFNSFGKVDIWEELSVVSETFKVPLDSLPTNNDSLTLRMQNIITTFTGTDFIRTNDTINHNQYFHNYFAFDDGTAEGGYGLNTRGGKIAYRFVLSHPDTLRGVMMYFNQMLKDVSKKNFYLTIWDKIYPENILFEQEATKPVYEYELNKFHYYRFEKGIYVQDTLYVGWKQTTTDLLNIGLDKNTNYNQNMFYNVLGYWVNSQIDGSWMIRPLLGDTLPIYTGYADVQDFKNEFMIYPNPADNVLNIHIKNNLVNESNYKLCIFNVLGEVYKRYHYLPQFINTRELTEGIYLIQITDDVSKNVFTKKIVIMHY